MPWYNDLRPSHIDENREDYALIFPAMRREEKIRCIERLLQLRQGLSAEIPPRNTDRTILLASWNIKEFGHTTQRLPESYFYIAEILSKFDLIAVQEIKSSLIDLNIILRILGSDWAYMVNDITEGDSGNDERSAYIYHRKSIELAGVAGEITLWEDLTHGSSIKQLKRTPYITGFKAGWKQFSLINLHLHPGDGDNGDGTNDIDIRREEVRLFLEAVEEKLRRRRFWNDNLVVLGDFNFYDDTLRTVKDGPTIQLFNDHQFREIPALQGVFTNVSQTQVYDRLFFHINEYFHIQTDEQGNEMGGVFNPFNYVYTDADVNTYQSELDAVYNGALTSEQYYHRYWKKNQLSDHLPIWTQIIIDSSDDFLASRLDLLRNEADG